MEALDAIRLLIQKFPMVVSKPNPESELLDTAPPYYAYERFADLIRKRLSDPEFVKSAASFINWLAESDDELLQDVVHVSVLENLASDISTARALRNHLHEKALSMLETIERDVYGR